MVREDKRLAPTEIGITVNDLLVERFPDLKVQLVEHFPDVKIQYVQHFPGAR